jgi:hypothetical protein
MLEVNPDDAAAVHPLNKVQSGELRVQYSAIAIAEAPGRKCNELTLVRFQGPTAGIRQDEPDDIVQNQEWEEYDIPEHSQSDPS